MVKEALPPINDILNEINRLQSEQITGFTTAELMEKTGKCDNWCREHIRKLIKLGKLKLAGRVERTTIDGKRCKVPIYQPIKESNK